MLQPIQQQVCYISEAFAFMYEVQETEHTRKLSATEALRLQLQIRVLQAAILYCKQQHSVSRGSILELCTTASAVAKVEGRARRKEKEEQQRQQDGEGKQQQKQQQQQHSSSNSNITVVTTTGAAIAVAVAVAAVTTAATAAIATPTASVAAATAPVVVAAATVGKLRRKAAAEARHGQSQHACKLIRQW